MSCVTIHDIQNDPTLDARYKALLAKCPQKRKLDPKLITCPRCNTAGRAGQYHPKPSKQTVRYFVVHYRIPGTWGRRDKIGRLKRCYMREGRESEAFEFRLKWDGELLPFTISNQRPPSKWSRNGV